MHSRLRQHDIAVSSERIAKLEGTKDGALKSIHLQGGKLLKRTALFFTTGCHQKDPTFQLYWAAPGTTRAAS